jgi:NAD(P)-dependent dehydrogenase (short-subunit alcohol dehydrogenase family)
LCGAPVEAFGSFWNDKQILITGATNGIGLAAAEALAALGANLAIVGRSKTRTCIASARQRDRLFVKSCTAG